jgi:hypothetical protein
MATNEQQETPKETTEKREHDEDSEERIYIDAETAARIGSMMLLSDLHEKMTAKYKARNKELKQ